MGFLRNQDRRSRRLSVRSATAALALVAYSSNLGMASPRTPVSRTTKNTGTRPHPPAITSWEAAERARDAFEATPEIARTRADYTRVMERFRTIYHENPRDSHAAEAINAVAELLAEAGRDLRDRKSFEAAVGQYEFLRTQYPGSSLRVGALLAEAQIEQNELHDAVTARQRYELLLKSYPHSALAEQARAGITSLNVAARQRPGMSGAGSANVLTSDSSRESRAGLPAVGTTGGSLTRAAGDGAPGRSGGHDGTATAVQSSMELPAPKPTLKHHGPLATVSGIRHWSTPSYTRVAIDLGEEVEYEAARVPSPDRILFDLHGAKLAPELVGKSFTVTDDGFLKRIRAAQSGGEVTRVVLDVNDVTEYSAFLLPNPYRLIIDIHGKPKVAQAQQVTVDSPAPKAVTVPNTRAMHAGSANELNALSDQPGKVQATSTPTSQPIAASVPARESGRDVSTLPATDITAANKTSSADSHPVGAVADTALPSYISTTSSPLQAASARRAKKGKGTTPADARVVGVPAIPARAAMKTADGQTSLVRALGLKINRIVIDAGHGGHDSGTLGVDGLQEKDVVLDVALRLGKLLHDRLGAEVTYTRSDDTFIPLETRTAIANKAQADLFLSIHANSSPDASARGVETYYLNFTQQADALEVAARENAVSGQSIHQLSDLVRKITLKDKLAESREFATDVEGSLYSGLARGNDGLKNRGVKKAPFVVLIGANMPSILAEISFLTNSRDATQLRQPDYKQRVAESLYKGVARYVGSLSSTTPAAAPLERAAATGQ